MPHLAKFRKGWSNENLAQYILYKFAFTANPSKIADDIGIDFICTLFQTEKVKSTTYLYPKNSFAIQIKSNRRNIPVTKKINLYNNLELPFYIGVVDSRKLLLTIYSGEFLHPFFSYKGTDLKLEIKLTDRAEVYSIDEYFEEIDKNSYMIFFPYLTEFNINENLDEMKGKISKIEKTSSMILDNISSKRNNEYIFRINGTKSSQLFMFAGNDSKEAFRENVINRITEAFYNLNWLFDNNPEFVNYEEYQMYKNFYNEWKRLGISKRIPDFLEDSFENLQLKIENYYGKE